MPDWLVYYNQTDERWAHELYGEVDYIEEAGCGPTVLSMAVSSLTDTQVSPKEMADWAAENGYCAPGSGSYHTLIADGLKHFELECATTNDGAEVQKALQAGYPVIALMGEGHFTGGGHFILLCNIDARNEVFVADPKSVENTEKLWPLDTILAEAKISPTTNGAYWIIRQQV
ncbi:C39 family peptidase [Anaerotignum lactatifermentans]|uniref:C39 family peptidase n=1 Tax=Anaerotignum lactatifermentans TaxID=160404 RepID=UPI0024B0E093|nr:C39 family peptidase [Anaerotignum lactatifermentans]